MLRRELLHEASRSYTITFYVRYARIYMDILNAAGYLSLLSEIF